MLALPNWHPFFVHFPVALFSTAVLCDIVLMVRYRLLWLDRTTLVLYCCAALSSLLAAVGGKLAADRLTPELTSEVVALAGRHGDWAFFTVVLFFVVAAARFDSLWRDRTSERPRAHSFRIATLLLAIVGETALLVTADRGGDLVYRHGVGVEVRDNKEEPSRHQ